MDCVELARIGSMRAAAAAAAEPRPVFEAAPPDARAADPDAETSRRRAEVARLKAAVPDWGMCRYAAGGLVSSAERLRRLVGEVGR